MATIQKVFQLAYVARESLDLKRLTFFYKKDKIVSNGCRLPHHRIQDDLRVKPETPKD